MPAPWLPTLSLVALLIGLPGGGAVAQRAIAPDNPQLIARIAAADPAAGEAIAGARCAGCHSFAEGAAAGVGPNIYNVVGAAAGDRAGYVYSAAFRALNAQRSVWTYDRLDVFLAGPAIAVPGTRMGFSGLAEEGDRASVIAYLRTLSAAPVPLPGIAVAGEPGEPQLNPVAFAIFQADVGGNQFDRLGCGDCHGGTLRGGPDGPPLVGEAFTGRWFNGTVWRLFSTMQRTMPPVDAGGMPAERYAQFLAFLLRANGFVGGDTILPTDRATLEQMGFRQ